ncbi:MAG: M23 family metallopeptidase [Acidobacteria bacterium]|nr:M23 family metallopeptidase [Acidobacteriota bacterium]
MSRSCNVLRIASIFVLVIIVAVGGGYLLAGFAAAPAIEVMRPRKAVGTDGTLEMVVHAEGRLSRFDAFLEQQGQRYRVFSLDDPSSGTKIQQEAENRMRVTAPLGKRAIPALRPGPARLTVTAARPVLYGLRTLETIASRDLELRFTPPRLSIASRHHFVNHGGAEMAVYRVSPSEVESAVQVGDTLYPGFPASGAGVTNADLALKVSFFALVYDQDLGTAIRLFARDEAGNTARANFDHRIFPKPMRRSRIEITDEFMRRTVPDIVEHSPELGSLPLSTDEELLQAFLRVNGELRRKNADKIASFAAETSPQIVWEGAFTQLSNSQVESTFADHRTYFYKGREIDQQVHLGFDLAVTANVPVHASNTGKVLYADYLGIYGNCAIIDHGMGVQTLYGHLASLDVKPGDRVTKGQTIGRSGMTGLAGGDHLHFTMLVNGRMVSPVEWWDPHWIEDRVMRKLREAGAQAAPASATAQAR